MLEDIIGFLTDEGFDFYGIETSTGINQFRIEVITDGNRDYPLPIQRGSQGTLSILIMFGLIHNYLYKIHEKTKNRVNNNEGIKINNEKGIVIIDEIDAHLHPAWQQKIVGLLRKTFPNVQFILSAHSPLVVAGCKEREVVVLRKQESVFSLHQCENDFIGYTATEIYERIFEVDPVDDEYNMYLARVYEIPEIENRIKELENLIANSQKSLENKGKTGASNNEELRNYRRELDEKYDDLHYLNKTKRKHDKNKEFERMFMENRKLKYDLELEKQKNANLK